MKPCEQGLKCKYSEFDYHENTEICTIDYDGSDCPYEKPYDKQKYIKDHTGKE